MWQHLLLAPFDRGSQAAEQSEIDSVLREAVERGDVPGVVAMAATSEKIIYEAAYGKRFVGQSEEMTLDSVFWIASMTKPVTSVAAMQLVEEGHLSLDTPASQYLPGFAELQVLEGIDATTHKLQLRPPKRPVTARHLLTHAAGFGYEMWNPLLHDAMVAGMLPGIEEPGDGFLKAPLVADPGEQWQYGISTNWLGRIVENVRGTDLDQALATHVFRPLRMDDTHFNLPASKVPRLVTLHARQNDGTLVETPRSTPALVTYFDGGGGLLSTAADYTRFLRALLRGGELDGVQILKADTVALMGKNQIGELEAGKMRTVMPQLSNDVDFFPGSANRFGLGFLINTQPVDGGRAAESLAWAGLFNTYFWVDPKQDVCGVLMTQILPFYDAKAIELLGQFERAVYKHTKE